MTTVAPVTTPVTTGKQSSAMKELSGNFDTFLTLLTTQLQNQDPLSPMDANQFTQQLVQFSQVEQQISTNDNLTQLVQLAQGRSTNDAVSYLGKKVTITTGQTPLTDGEANWTYGLGGTSAASQLTVSDQNGKVVYTGTGETAAGQHAFAWNGKDNSGNQLPDGVYTLSINAKAVDGGTVDTAVASQGLVDEVNLTGSTPLLMIGPMGIPLASVAAVES